MIQPFVTRLILCSAILLTTFGLLPALEGAVGETMAVRRLRLLVEEERRMLAAARQPDGTHDESLLEARYQNLVHKYDSFLSENPDFTPGLVAYARMLERIGREEAALALYLRANRLDPNIPLVKNQIGNHLVESGHFDQALPYYLAAIELEPGEALYHLQLGNLLHLFRDDFLDREIFTRTVLDEKMLKAFRQAAELAPENIGFAYRHAEAFYDLATPRWEEAEAVWRALRKKTKTGLERETVDLHLANIAVKRGQKEVAQTLLHSVNSPLLAANKARVETALAVLKEKKSPAKTAPNP